MRLSIIKPNPGDKRKIKRFAWFPIRIDNNTVVWLEEYWSHESYDVWCGRVRDYDRWHSYAKELIEFCQGK